MMERQQVLDQFTEYVRNHLADQRLGEEARWVYLRLRAGGDPVTILQRFHDSKVRTGIEGSALQSLIDEVRR